MSLCIAIQMDDPATFNPQKDSTIALALEAQKRSHRLWYYLPSSLSIEGQNVIAHPAYPITFYKDSERWFEAGPPVSLDLKRNADVVLMRQDPPFDMSYITATYMLDRLTGHTYVANNPSMVRNDPEKLSIFHFPDFIPQTLVTRDISLIETFRNAHSDIVVKPLYGHGGHAVYRFKPDDSNLHTLLEQFFTSSKEPLMVQPFLPEVASKDQRVIMIDGNVSAVIGRIPQEGHMRANLRVGGSATQGSLNEQQQKLCADVGQYLKEHGILFAGLDLIGDYLTEINTTSPTLLREAEKLLGINVAAIFWDTLEARL